MKRENYLNWNEYFMGIAYLSAQRSKDPVTQVGACIVDETNRIKSIGYNGFPNRISDEDLPWSKDGSYLENKYAYVCHAELNAILNNLQNLNNCSIFITLFPCNECAKLIIQSGIIKVIYAENKYQDSDSVKASMKMLELANIEIEKYSFTNKIVSLNL